MTLVTLSRRAPLEMPDGAYDVRGWEVRTTLGQQKVGRIDDMLLDEDGNPRYLDVDLGLFKKHILVPLAEAHADAADQVVWIDNLDQDRLSLIPEYRRDPERLSEDYERRLLDEYRSLRDRDLAAPIETFRPMGLARLGDLDDFRVASGVTDPRGWKVVGGDGNKLGEVSELIVDPDALSTRYLDVRVDEKPLDLEPLDRHVLVPVERARLDRKAKSVVVDAMFGRDLKDYPLYQGLPLDEDAQREVQNVYQRSSDGRRRDPAAARFFGARARPGDAAPVARARRVRTRAAEEEEIETSEDRTVTAGDGDEVRIRVSGEDIIIEKHPTGRRDDG